MIIDRIRGLIYNHCVHTKPALKETYATSYAKGGIYKKQTWRENLRTYMKTLTHVNRILS